MNRYESDESQKQLAEHQHKAGSLEGAFEGSIAGHDNAYINQEATLMVQANQSAKEVDAKSRMTTSLSEPLSTLPDMPSAEKIDYAGMEQDGYGLTPDQDGRITVPLNRTVPGEYVAGGVDLKTGHRFDNTDVVDTRTVPTTRQLTDQFMNLLASAPGEPMSFTEWAGAVTMGDITLDPIKLGESSILGQDIELDPNVLNSMWRASISATSSSIKDLANTIKFVSGNNEVVGSLTDALKGSFVSPEQYGSELTAPEEGIALLGKIATMWRMAGMFVPGARETISKSIGAELGRDAVLTFMWDPSEGNLVDMFKEFGWMDEETLKDWDTKELMAQSDGDWLTELEARMRNTTTDSLVLSGLVSTITKMPGLLPMVGEEGQAMLHKAGVTQRINVYEKGAELEKKGLDRLKGSGGVRLNSGIDPDQLLGAAEMTAGQAMKLVGKADATKTALNEIASGYAMSMRSRAKFAEDYGHLYSSRELNDAYDNAVKAHKAEQRMVGIDTKTPAASNEITYPEDINPDDMLIATHSVMSSNLDQMLRQPSAPNLSIAVHKVSDKETPHKFGEITFIGDQNIVKPSPEMDVYSADAYTARHPATFTDEGRPEEVVEDLYGKITALPEDVQPLVKHMDVTHSGQTGVLKTDLRYLDTTESGYYSNENILAYMADTGKTPTKKVLNELAKSLGMNAYSKLDDADKVMVMQRYAHDVSRDKDYMSWLDAQSENIPKYFTTDQGARMLATPENISAHMPRGRLHETERKVGYGNPHQMKARIAQKFDSLQAMSDNRHLLDEKTDAAIRKVETDANQAQVVFNDMYPYEDEQDIWELALTSRDTGYDALLKKYPKLKKYLAPIERTIQGVENMKTPYFEAKAAKPVPHKDWQAVLVPDDLNPAYVEQLEKRGVAAIKYRAGDPMDKHQKLQEHGSKYMFSAGGVGSAELIKEDRE